VAAKIRGGRDWGSQGKGGLGPKRESDEDIKKARDAEREDMTALQRG